MPKIDLLIKDAMKSRNAAMLKAFRAVKSKIMLETTRSTPSTLSAEELFMRMLVKEVKERNEANSFFKDKSHPDYLENCKIIEGLSDFLPKKLPADEQNKLVKKIIIESGAKNLSDIGIVMSQLKEHKLSLDMRLASQQVKDALSVKK